MDGEPLLVEALDQLGIEARLGTADGPVGVDLVIDPDGVALPVEVKRRATVTEAVAREIVTRHRLGHGTLVVVGDRVTDGARRLLLAEHAGYYDLRGRLGIRTDALVAAADIKPLTSRGSRIDPLGGRAGLEVAAAILGDPRGVTVRELARGLGRSASTVSEILAGLRRDGLVDTTNAIADSRLFWQVADRWTAPRTYLAEAPHPRGDPSADALHLGIDDPQDRPGWALTDTAAAVAYGAPIAMRADSSLDFFVPDEMILRRSLTLLGPAPIPSHARATVRVAPVPAACEHRVVTTSDPHGWPLAQPLFVALDLAQDHDRGRAVLEAWTPSEPWVRVW